MPSNGPIATLLSIGVALSVLTAAAGDLARADEREVLIGTFQTNTGATPADERWLDKSVQELFSEGMARIERGHVWAGQRRLEVLVSRFPRSAEAARARRVLGEIYRGAPPDAPAAADSGARARDRAEVQPTPAGQGDTTRLELPPAGAPGGAIAATGEAAMAPVAQWKPELERSRRLEDVLRAEAGDRVFFSESSAEIGSRARAVLTGQARWLSRNPYVHVTIEGHADESGSDARNLAISTERAEAVRERLIEAGIAASRLTVVGKGRSDRIAACDSPLCAAQNRRAVMLLFVEARSGAGRSGESLRSQGRMPLAAQEEAPALAPAPGSPR